MIQLVTNTGESTNPPSVSVMGIMKETQVHVNKTHINNPSSAANNATPKPPKKRYLENSEFRSSKFNQLYALTIKLTSCSSALAGPMPGIQQPPVNSATATIPLPVTTSQTVNNSLVPKLDKKATIAPLGPPGMLDGDTMSRVIVDALAAGPNPHPSTYMNYDSPPTASAKPVSDGDGERVGGSSDGLPSFMRGRSNSPESPSYQNTKNEPNGGNNPTEHGPKIRSVASLTAESLLNAESQQPLGSATKTVAAIVSAKHSTSSTGIMELGSNAPVLASSAAALSPSPSVEEDKPLNLSSSKVLHASHQQIIDHFIDKLLSSGGECGEGQCQKHFLFALYLQTLSSSRTELVRKPKTRTYTFRSRLVLYNVVTLLTNSASSFSCDSQEIRCRLK